MAALGIALLMDDVAAVADIQLCGDLGQRIDGCRVYGGLAKISTGLHFQVTFLSRRHSVGLSAGIVSCIIDVTRIRTKRQAADAFRQEVR